MELFYSESSARLGLRFALNGRNVRAVLEPNTDMSALRPPVATVLPAVDPQGGMVKTRVLFGAEFAYLDHKVIGPLIQPAIGDQAADLLSYLGRSIDQSEADPQPEGGRGYRYVEPGVGRSLMIDFVNFSDSCEFSDFTVTGAGLTQYSRRGYFFEGPHIDGRLAVGRAWHRHRLSERLARAGCRVPRTAAIITAAELTHIRPDGTREPGSLLVRGFRSVLRVKQLDPLANVLMSSVDWTAPIHDRIGERGRDPESGASLPCTCVNPGFLLGTRPGRRCGPESACRGARLTAITQYAPTLINYALRTLTGSSEVDSAWRREYVRWFASTLGRQLAVFRDIRFLHDYRVNQQDLPDPFYLLDSLNDTNITLAAEFADLDTGICVDQDDPSVLEVLGISAGYQHQLATHFSRLHAVERQLARGVAQSLEIMVLGSSKEVNAAAAFDGGYGGDGP